jgi:hypothetical protein
MMPQFSTMMREAISNVLETMFFLVPAFDEGENRHGFHQRPFFLESSIVITGQTQHLRLLFRATRAFASVLTSNFLGVGQDEVAPDEMEDTLKELANMVGGDFLARLPAANWELGIPRLEPPKTDVDACFTPDMYSLALSLDEELMALVHFYAEP